MSATNPRRETHAPGRRLRRPALQLPALPVVLDRRDDLVDHRRLKNPTAEETADPWKKKKQYRGRRPDYVARMQDLRRSNAARAHDSARHKGTRAHRLRQAIDEDTE